MSHTTAAPPTPSAIAPSDGAPRRRPPTVPARVRFEARPERSSVRRGGSGLARLATVTALPLGILLLWWAATAFGWISPLLLASPGQVAEQFATRWADGSLLRDLGASLRRVGIGLTISIVLGTTLGVISGLSNWGHRFLDGTLHLIKAVPFPALIPLLLIWLGIGENLRIGTLVLAATFSIYLNTVGGIVSIDPRLRELAETRGVRGWRQITSIVLPGALPQFLTGLRLALVISFLALVFAEEIAPQEGLGYILWRAAQFSQTDSIILVAVIYAVLGLLISGGVSLLERVLLPWRKGFRA